MYTIMRHLNVGMSSLMSFLIPKKNKGAIREPLDWKERRESRFGLWLLVNEGFDLLWLYFILLEQYLVLVLVLIIEIHADQVKDSLCAKTKDGVIRITLLWGWFYWETSNMLCLSGIWYVFLISVSGRSGSSYLLHFLIRVISSVNFFCYHFSGFKWNLKVHWYI